MLAASALGLRRRAKDARTAPLLGWKQYSPNSKKGAKEKKKRQKQKDKHQSKHRSSSGADESCEGAIEVAQQAVENVDNAATEWRPTRTGLLAVGARETGVKVQVS